MVIPVVDGIDCQQFLESGVPWLNVPIVPAPVHLLHTKESSNLNFTSGAKCAQPQQSHDRPGAK